MSVTRWWWVRHAPVINPDNIIYGQRDVPCDTSDRQSFKALAEVLPAEAVWVTSPLSRSRDTAAAIAAQGLDAPQPLIEADLAEQCLGDWEGKTWDDFDMETDADYRAFWRDAAGNAPPGGESFSDVCRRVRAVIERLNAEHAAADIIAVAHGGPIRAAVALSLSLAPEKALAIKTGTLSLTRLDFIANEGEHVAYGLRAGPQGSWRVAGINTRP